MNLLRNILAIFLLAATATAFPPQQARSVVPPAQIFSAAPTPVADLARQFHLIAPPTIDNALNQAIGMARGAWVRRPHLHLRNPAKVPPA